MMPDDKWCHDVMRHEMCERLSCEICKAHLPGPCSSSVPPPAPPSAAQWGLMMHGLRHANSMACDCLVRFTRRASSSPALLALLPLEDDVLRERPQAACLVIGGDTKTETLSPQQGGSFFAPAVRRGSCYLLHAHTLLRCLPSEGTPRDVSCLDRWRKACPSQTARGRRR